MDRQSGICDRHAVSPKRHGKPTNIGKQICRIHRQRWIMCNCCARALDEERRLCFFRMPPARGNRADRQTTTCALIPRRLILQDLLSSILQPARRRDRQSKTCDLPPSGQTISNMANSTVNNPKAKAKHANNYEISANDILSSSNMVKYKIPETTHGPTTKHLASKIINCPKANPNDVKQLDANKHRATENVSTIENQTNARNRQRG